MQENICKMNHKDSKIAIVGLGYVGLPLAVAFAEKYSVIGFDIDQQRISELLNSTDTTFEIKEEQLQAVLIKTSKHSKGLTLTTDSSQLSDCTVYIITVPTPIDKHNRPVLSPMIKASETVARYLKKGDIVIYESTVYPGVTEDEMVPVLENISELIFNKDFFCGYSPEYQSW